METATLWHRVLNDPELQNLPYKIETNEHGQLVLSPHKPQHGYFQMRIGELLRDHMEPPGRRAVEFAVETAKGVKVPDVVWVSEERWGQIPEDAEASPVMPELCVEVLSESNTDAELAEKRALYFAEGGQEVWTCDADGGLHVYTDEGRHPTSTLAPDIPDSIA
ncbi:MAG: Uma2 family endonuclease [Bacteroidetes bacterium SW_9_63_38]|nr:MAG: Uma2 family endonuclease [Bacteroidetes bacterium SW_9_63_38]